MSPFASGGLETAEGQKATGSRQLSTDQVVVHQDQHQGLPSCIWISIGTQKHMIWSCI